jgi:acetyl esterase/lipase
MNNIKFHPLPMLFTVAFLLLGYNTEAQNKAETSGLTVEPIIWNVWPGEAPGEEKKLEAEYDTTKPDGELVAGQRVIRLTNVSVPQLAIYKPNPAIDTHTAVVIAPGGGHQIIAYDLEGTEVAAWLNSMGVTAIILKYRVPGAARNNGVRWMAAAQDGQRAMSLVRSRAKEIGIDPNKLGIIGFSAGGTPVKYTALTSKRLYEPVDQHDETSFRPDFAAPIYTSGLPKEAEVNENCPPFFMVVTNDDFGPVMMAEMYIALKKAKVSAEFHIYESGGHGYGLRATELPVTSWPNRMEEWMQRLGFL